MAGDQYDFYLDTSLLKLQKHNLELKKSKRALTKFWPNGKKTPEKWSYVNWNVHKIIQQSSDLMEKTQKNGSSVNCSVHKNIQQSSDLMEKTQKNGSSVNCSVHKNIQQSSDLMEKTQKNDSSVNCSVHKNIVQDIYIYRYRNYSIHEVRKNETGFKL